LIWYPGDDGSSKKIDAKSIRSDITKHERDAILNSEAYKLGFVVEYTDDAPPVEQTNFNALNDNQIKSIMKEYKITEDKTKFKKIVDGMDSIYALQYFQDKISAEAPGFLLKYVESRIGELREEEERQMTIIPHEPKET
jgi:hypothetical protein